MIEIPKKEPLNIVPFIDIMLVLLAMVLSISTFIAKGEIKINLPASKTAAQAENVKDPLLVQVDAAGDFFRDGTRVSFEDSPRRLPESRGINPCFSEWTGSPSLSTSSA